MVIPNIFNYAVSQSIPSIILVQCISNGCRTSCLQHRVPIMASLSHTNNRMLLPTTTPNNCSITGYKLLTWKQAKLRTSNLGINCTPITHFSSDKHTNHFTSSRKNDRAIGDNIAQQTGQSFCIIKSHDSYRICI